MRRELIVLTVIAAAVVAAFGATVLVLDSTLYSASGFVRSYLDSLARHDVDGALDLAGTVTAGDASRSLLTADALGELSDIRLVSDDADAQGIHHVVYAFTADGQDGQSTFSVQPRGTLLGLFPLWSFESTPLGVLQVVPQHGTTFTVNGLHVEAPTADQVTPYLVFVPGTYELASTSRYLEARPVPVTASQPGAAVIGIVTLKPTAALVAEVRKQIAAYLDGCTTQRVLLPTGCPFGEEVANRIVSTPTWSMARYPSVSLQPGPQPGTWLMPSTPAAAHLVVDVRSLFDGTVSTFDEDVPFDSSYLVTLLPGDRVSIQAQ